MDQMFVIHINGTTSTVLPSASTGCDGLRSAIKKLLRSLVSFSVSKRKTLAGALARNIAKWSTGRSQVATNHRQRD